MIAFFFLAGAVLLLLAHNAPARQQPEGRVSRWDVLFAAEGDGVYLVLMILAALLTLAAAPFCSRRQLGSWPYGRQPARGTTDCSR